MGRRRIVTMALALAGVATAAGAVAASTGAPPASAAPGYYQIRNVDSNGRPWPCLSALAHPATYQNSAIVTVACAAATPDNPPPARQRWDLGLESPRRGWFMIGSTIPHHNGLCMVEYTPSHQVRLNPCPFTYAHQLDHKTGWWGRRVLTARNGATAAMYINKQTGRCMSAQTANATHGTNVTTEPCDTSDPRQLWQVLQLP